MKREDLEEILKKHIKWIRDEKGGERANLSGANLSGADLSGANLSGANLYRADLSGADLSGADLSGANLYRANLSGANLYRADLSGANLYRADLSGANLSGADLSGADLSGANLYRADLSGANLYRADIKELKNGELVLSQMKILSEGSLIGWKKCSNGVMVKLLIPSKARRSNSTGRKCRAEYVRVLEVIGSKVGISSHDQKTTYIKGKTVKCDKWEEDPLIECGGGIHFFITRIEAETY